MTKKQKAGMSDTLVTVVVLAVVIILGGASLYLNHQHKQELNEVGQILCHQKGYEFWYASGSTIRCYTQDNGTAIRTAHEFWIDFELARAIYVGEQP